MNNVTFRAGVTIKNTNFSNTKLRHCKFECEVSEADFSNSRIVDVDFSGGKKLEKSKFINAEIDNADFSGCDLSHSSFKNSTLRSCAFDGVDATKVKIVQLSGKNNSYNGAKVVYSKEELEQIKSLGSTLSADLVNNSIPNTDGRASITQDEINEFRTKQTTKPKLKFSDHFKAKLKESKDLSGLDLSDIKFKGENLSGYNFRGANLSNSIIEGCNLSKANFDAATLTGSEISKTDLRGAKFQYTILDNVEITGSNMQACKISHSRGAKLSLTGCDLSFSKIDNSALESAKFTNVTLNESILDKSNFNGSTFDQCKVQKCVGTEMKMSKATITKSDFSGSSFREGDFTGATIEKSNFSKTDLTGATFAKVSGEKNNFSDAVLDGSDCRGANLSNADFSNASLEKADLTKVDFGKSNLQNAKLFNATINSTEFNSANCKGADLSYAKGKDTNFSGANVSDADLTGAILETPQLHTTDMSRSKLMGAKITFKGQELKDVRFNDAEIDYATELKIHEGKDVAIAKPNNSDKFILKDDEREVKGDVSFKDACKMSEVAAPSMFTDIRAWIGGNLKSVGDKLAVAGDGAESKAKRRRIGAIVGGIAVGLLATGFVASIVFSGGISLGVALGLTATAAIIGTATGVGVGYKVSGEIGYSAVLGAICGTMLCPGIGTVLGGLVGYALKSNIKHFTGKDIDNGLSSAFSKVGGVTRWFGEVISPKDGDEAQRIGRDKAACQDVILNKKKELEGQYDEKVVKNKGLLESKKGVIQGERKNHKNSISGSAVAKTKKMVENVTSIFRKKDSGRSVA
jgi:uncharacterized protein YjbI with pentapeptide repeats